MVQEKDKADGWKKFAGLSKPIQIQLVKADYTVIVKCDFGKLSDKIDAGGVGIFVFAPMAVTSAIGAVTQLKLPQDVLAEIEKFIMPGGEDAIVSLGGQLKEEEVGCPACGCKNAKGQKFCKECEAKLDMNCPDCGALLARNTKLCPECGSKVSNKLICQNCNAELATGVLFYPQCG